MATGRPGRRQLKIGELERALGVTRDQVHHYVELGLVPPPTKTAATLAWYGPEHQAAIARVRAIREAGGSLAQAQRWLVGSLAGAGPADCATLTHWVLGDRAVGRPEDSRGGAGVTVDAVIALVDAELGRLAPDALVAAAAGDRTRWLDELAARWRERDENARVTVAKEALAAASTARLVKWLPIAASGVEGGWMRAAVLDQRGSGEGLGDDERARLAVMVHVPPPAEGLAGADGWSLAASAMASMRARRWGDARAVLARARPGAAGTSLANALGWCNDAMEAVAAGDGVLPMVARL